MKKVRTLFISDIHLGSSKSSATKLLELFKSVEFENLIIIGDFIDLTSLKRKFFWQESHSTVIQKVLRLSRKNCKVIYVLGNHDYYLRDLIAEENINLGSITICDDWIWTTALGDIAYEWSFKINKIYNKMRRLFGLEYWSLSAYLKSKVKNAVLFINDFKILSLKKIKEKGVDSIMIGHIHTPEICKIGGKNYYNTGDFCESCSYLLEDLEGTISLHLMS